MVNETEIRTRFEKLAPFLNERTRRLAAAAEAAAIGRRGIARVSRATGVSRRAIASGLDQLKTPDEMDAGRIRRIRRPGGGRKATGNNYFTGVSVAFGLMVISYFGRVAERCRRASINLISLAGTFTPSG